MKLYSLLGILALVLEVFVNCYISYAQITVHFRSLHSQQLGFSQSQRKLPTCFCPPSIKINKVDVQEKHACKKTIVEYLSIKGGSEKVIEKSTKLIGTELRKGNVLSFPTIWGFTGVLCLFGNAMRKMAPYALQPFTQGMSPTAWFAYATFTGFMVLVKGYLVLHRKFCPLVVKRALLLGSAKDCKKRLVHIALAPIFSMGLFHATRKRKIAGWATLSFIVILVTSIKRLPYPWRQIVNGGVFSALLTGACSIMYYVLGEILGTNISVDPALPTDSPYSM